MSTLESNRRRFTRINLDAATKVKYEKSVWRANLMDISFSGMLLSCNTPIPLEIGDQVEITVQLLGHDVIINTCATLAHSRNDHYGFSIANLDLDALTLIRRIVELNLGDETLLERELDQLFLES